MIWLVVHSNGFPHFASEIVLASQEFYRKDVYPDYRGLEFKL
jgi:hypothetical protein